MDGAGVTTVGLLAVGYALDVYKLMYILESFIRKLHQRFLCPRKRWHVV